MQIGIVLSVFKWYLWRPIHFPSLPPARGTATDDYNPKAPKASQHFTEHSSRVVSKAGLEPASVAYGKAPPYPSLKAHPIQCYCIHHAYYSQWPRLPVPPLAHSIFQLSTWQDHSPHWMALPLVLVILYTAVAAGCLFGPDTALPLDAPGNHRC